MHDLAQWYSVADDGTLVEPTISHFEDGLMQKYYRGWEGSGARLDRAWTGIMGVCFLVSCFASSFHFVQCTVMLMWR
jgi:hypothetical protein